MIFLGCLFNREREKEILRLSKVGISNAVNTFEWNLIDGFIDNGVDDLKIINVLPVGTYPKYYKRLVLEDKDWNYKNFSRNKEIGSLNLPIIKQSVRYRKIKKLLSDYKDKEIVIYSTYLPFLKAVKNLDRSYKITLIVTDLPEYYDLSKTNFIKKLLRKINNKKIYKCLNRVDRFVLLTEQMKTALNVNDRPYAVVEGIAGVSGCDISKNTYGNGKKIILYTGALYKKFGIIELINAFTTLNGNDYELWLAGSGDVENEIVSFCKKDSRIKFFGYVTKDKIYDLQRKASVLVNPRKNDGEYTKYSFPSKTLEYMSSGVPVLMYKLDGIPVSYDKYLNYIEGDGIDALAKSLEKICSLDKDELKAKGQKAMDFVTREKSSKAQSKKILELISTR